VEGRSGIACVGRRILRYSTDDGEVAGTDDGSACAGSSKILSEPGKLSGVDDGIELPGGSDADGVEQDEVVTNVVLPESSEFFQPREGSFDHPLPGRNGKGLGFAAFGDLHGCAEFVVDRVGEGLPT
jgi:hypothetical protein